MDVSLRSGEVHVEGEAGCLVASDLELNLHIRACQVGLDHDRLADVTVSYVHELDS